MADPGTTTAAADGLPSLSVGIFSPNWPPSHCTNGIVTYVDAIAKGLKQLGHRPYILARTISGPVVKSDTQPVIDLRPLGEGVGPIRLAEKLVSRLRPHTPSSATQKVTRGLRRAVQGGAGLPQLDILELEESFGLPGGVAGRSSVPVIARLHGPWFLNGPNQGADPSTPEFADRVRIERQGLLGIDGVTAPSRDVLNRTRGHYGLVLEGAEAIANPVRLVPPDLQWRPEKAEAELVLFVGRFDRHKGGDTIIDAFARLLQERPEARLMFVGPDRGLVQDGQRWSLPLYIEHRLPGALEDGRIRWLGPRPPEEISALRTRAAVTVVASRYETFAITATEAMAAGCPLVATRAGGTSEIFEHDHHGLYVEPEDPDGLATAMASLLADPARAATLGKAAREYCERRYAPEVIASETIRFYRKVLAGRLGRKEARP